MTKTEARVLRAIQNAYPHAIRKTELSPVTPRAFEAAVRSLRVIHRQPIASDGEGYWFAQTPQELRDTAEGLLRRMAAVAETRDALLSIADGLEAPQRTLFFGEAA